MLGGGHLRAQDLSTVILPSEDEIIQARRSGDITYQQYIILLEIAAHGIDSTNIHLLDEIPNLSFFSPDTNTLSSNLEKEQESSFTTGTPPTKQAPGILSGKVQHTYCRYTDENGNFKFHSKLGLRYHERFSADMNVRRDYSSYERVTSRTFAYRNRRGPVKRNSYRQLLQTSRHGDSLWLPGEAL